MAVERLPDPRLVTDSMGSGGTPHVSYGQSPPGSPSVEPVPQEFEVPDLAAVMTSPGSPGTDRNRISPDGARAPEQDSPTPQGTQFTQFTQFAQADTEDSNAALWKKTVSSS